MCNPADLTNALLHNAQWLFGPTGVHAVDDGEKRKQHHRDQHQEPIDRRKADDSEDHKRDNTDTEWQRVDDFTRRDNVGVSVRQKFTRWCFTVIFQRHREIRVRQLATPVALGSIRQECSEVATKNDRRSSKQSHKQQRKSGEPHRLGFRSTRFERRNDHLVGDTSKDDRGADCSTCVNRGAKDRNDERNRVGFDISRQESRAATE
ncbi:unannotated protein [freshwater metagenome]|uniref:Unannotated protein n=1 Tax=freshwater metagenome TaxID=449393 RepID=A0A6J6I0H0_9ZZZZ